MSVAAANLSSLSAGVSRVAALHRQGDAWRLVIVEGGGARPPRVVSAQSLAAGDAGAVRSALERHSVTRLLRLLPGSRVVCRVAEAPAARGVEASAAFGLLAEAMLPAVIPAHRRGAARAEDVSGGSSGGGAVLVGWAGDAPEAAIGGVEEWWTPEPIALLWLLRRGCVVARYADRATGSISVALRGQRGVLVRAMRDSSADGSEWARVVGERVEESASGWGVTVNGSMREVGAGGATLGLDARPGVVVEGIAGANGDDAWLGEYGVALGAACGVLIAEAGARGVYLLPVEAPRESVSAWEAAIDWLAKPWRAMAVVMAGLALALVGPMGVAAVRLAVLESRSGGVVSQREAEARQRVEAAFFAELEKRRWPMTSLAARVAGALPVGIVVESLRLESGQRVQVRGVAESLELVNQLQARLGGSGVFAEALIDRTQEREGGVEFDVSARVVRPWAEARGLEDFAARSLAERLYGEGVRGSEGGAEMSPSAATAEESRGSVRPASRERGEAARVKPSEVPAAITDEAIAALDATAAMREWTQRQKASKQAGLDAATRDRLAEEARKCQERMRAARKEGGR